jgi:hypothetical protein
MKKQKPLNTQKLDIVIKAQLEVERWDGIKMLEDSVETAVDELRQYGIVTAEIKGDLIFKIKKEL